MDGLLVALTVVATLGCGLNAGVFFAFSSFVMKALARLQPAGSACYLVGSIGLTIAYHVPRNNALVALQPQRAEAADRWTRYVAEWTRWTHLRAAASLAAAVSFTLALRIG